MKKTILPMLFAASILASCNKNDYHDPHDPHAPNQPGRKLTVLKASGDSSAIIGTINQFRSILGDSLNTAPGKTSGRREVNWDAVPANLTNNNEFPLDFFNSTDPAAPNGRKRGLVYLQTSAPLRVDSSSFTGIDPSYANAFEPFSRKKAIVSANSNVSEIVFKVAGTSTDAFVKGFGIIFSDVDNADYTSLEFFAGNKSLGLVKAPARNAAGGFSFLGVHFPDDQVTRIRITAGNGVLAPGYKDISDGGAKDLVVFDDIFYDEPKQMQ